METRNDIRAELATLSELVAGLPKVNVFTVPRGFFDTVPATVMACIQDGQLSGNDNNPAVPEGYFENLAGAILNKIKNTPSALEEINSLSPLLSSILDKNVFEVPVGYFEMSRENILNTVCVTQDEDQGSLSPLLLSIRDKNVYNIPEGYFTGLADNILKKLNGSSAKIVRMPVRSRILKYAAAAILVGAIAFGIVKFAGNSSNNLATPDLAAIDASIKKGMSMDDSQFNEALASLSTADIADYLEKNGDITDMVALGNSVDEKGLPSQDDYLLDEKTLENYLKQIDLTTLNN